MKQTSRDFFGIYPATPATYGDDGRINITTLNRLIERAISSGVDGFFVTGTTGECYLLEQEEKKQIITQTVKAVSRRAGIIAQISGLSTKNSIDLAKYAEDSGVDAIAVLPPIYYRYSAKDIINFYTDIASSVKIPFFIYEIPACTGISLLHEQFSEIYEIENCAGIKVSVPDIKIIKQFIDRYANIKLFVGSDDIFLDSLKLGAAGAVGSTYNIIPKEFSLLYSLFKSGHIKEAEDIQNKCNKFIYTLDSCGGLPAVKYAMQYIGVDVGEARKPFKTLSFDEKASVRQAYDTFISSMYEYEILYKTRLKLCL